VTGDELFRAERRGRTLRAVLDGEVDVSVAPALMERLRDAVDSDVDQVVLDLSGLTFIDSSGLRMILVLADRLRERRRALVLVVPETGIVRRVLSVSGVDIVVPVVASMDDVPEVPGAADPG
jgi:anti-sigma B factor antagonist